MVTTIGQNPLNHLYIYDFKIPAPRHHTNEKKQTFQMRFSVVHSIVLSLAETSSNRPLKPVATALSVMHQCFPFHSKIFSTWSFDIIKFNQVCPLYSSVTD